MVRGERNWNEKNVLTTFFGKRLQHIPRLWAEPRKGTHLGEGGREGGRREGGKERESE